MAGFEVITEAGLRVGSRRVKEKGSWAPLVASKPGLKVLLLKREHKVENTMDRERTSSVTLAGFKGEAETGSSIYRIYRGSVFADPGRPNLSFSNGCSHGHARPDCRQNVP